MLFHIDSDGKLVVQSALVYPDNLWLRQLMAPRLSKLKEIYFNLEFGPAFVFIVGSNKSTGLTAVE